MGQDDGGIRDGTADPRHPGWWLASDGRWYPPQPGTSPAPPPPPPGYAVATSPPPSNGTATAALIVGILSLLLFWAFGLGGILGIVAIVLGIRGTKRAAAHPARPGNGLAVGGIVTGAIGAFFGLIIGLIVAISFLGSEAQVEFEQIGEELDGGINSDPPDGFCDEDRFFQDPDC